MVRASLPFTAVLGLRFSVYLSGSPSSWINFGDLCIFKMFLLSLNFHNYWYSIFMFLIASIVTVGFLPLLLIVKMFFSHAISSFSFSLFSNFYAFFLPFCMGLCLVEIFK